MFQVELVQRLVARTSNDRLNRRSKNSDARVFGDREGRGVNGDGEFQLLSQIFIHVSSAVVALQLHGAMFHRGPFVTSRALFFTVRPKKKPAS